MKTSELTIGKVYHHQELGRVRLVGLPIDDPEGARVEPLKGGTGDVKPLSVDRDDLSTVDTEWETKEGWEPSNKYL